MHLLALARLSCGWRDAVRAVSPETLLRWHPDFFHVLRHERHQTVRFNVTAHSTVQGAARQIVEAYPSTKRLCRPSDGQGPAGGIEGHSEHPELSS